MKHIFIFLLSLVVFQATAQTIVDPSEFPTLSSPTMNNWAIYTREDKVNRKVLPAAIRALMLPIVRQPADITYTPAATGNPNDKGSFVKTPLGRIYFIDGLGNSIQTNFPYAAATIADNDVHAGSMCVPVGGWYRLSNSNTLGMPPGTLRQRVFGSLTPCTNVGNSISPGQTAVVGGSGVLKVNGDPDTNPYVKAQGQHYESSIAYDTLTRNIYTYNSAGALGNRWDVFQGLSTDTRLDTAYTVSDTLRLVIKDISGDSILTTISVPIPTTNYTAGYGIDIASGVISNSGVTTINGEAGDVVDYVKTTYPMGGDVVGDYAGGTTITALQGFPVDLGTTSPTSGDGLVYDGTSWVPGSIGGSGGGITKGPELLGSGVIGDSIRLSKQNAKYGESLAWNGQNWSPKQDDSYKGEMIYSTNYYTSTSDFTAVNTTPVAQNGYIRLSSGDGSVNNYLRLNVTPISDENLTISATYRMSGSTSVNGMGIGKRSINTWYPVSVHGVFVPQNNSLSLWQTNTSTKVAEIFLPYTPALGDILKLTYIESTDQVSIVFEDVTQKKINVVSAYDTYGVGASFITTNTGVPCVYNLSGTIDLLSLSSYSTSRAPYIVCVGDSKTKGFSSGSSSLRYPSLLSDIGNTQVFGGSGDRTIEIVQAISRLCQKKPKYAILCLGRNDLASSVSSATWQSNYMGIVDSLENYGVTVLHQLPLPESSGLDQSSLRSWILSNFSGNTIDTTGFVRATMVSSDGIHPNEFGYKNVAKQILSSGLIIKEGNKSIRSNETYNIYRYLAGVLAGSGTTDFLPRFTGSSFLGNSALSDNGTLVTSIRPFSINTSLEDKITLRGSNNPIIRFTNAAGSDLAILQSSSGFVRLYTFGNIPVVLSSNNVNVFSGQSTSVEVGRTGGYALPGTFIHGFTDVGTDYALVVAPFTFTIGTAPLVVTNAGKVGFGLNQPSARIHIAAGTASAATSPIKLTAGTNLTTPEAGALEWNGTNLFITQTSGPTRKTIAYTTDIPSADGNGIYSGSGNVPSGGSTVTATDANPLILTSTASSGNAFRFNITQGGGVQFNNNSGTQLSRFYSTSSAFVQESATRQQTIQGLTSVNLIASDGVKSALFTVRDSGYITLPTFNTFPAVTGDNKTGWNATLKKIQYMANSSVKTVANQEDDFKGDAFTIRTADFTLGTSNILSEIIDANSGAVVVTLGADLREGFDYVVKCRRNGTNTVTFSAGGSHVFEVDGSSSIAPTSLSVGGIGIGIEAPYKVYTIRRSGLNIFIK